MSDFELRPVESWYSEGADGFILYDPFTGQPLEPAQPPKALRADSRLQDGLDYAHHLGPKLTLGIYYGVSESYHNDLGSAEFEGLLLDPDNNIRALGHTVCGTLRDYAGRLSLPRTRANQYTERLDAATAGLPIARFCVGREVLANGSPAGPAETRLEQVAAAVRQQRLDPTDNGGALLAASVIHRNYQEWYTALRTGEQLGMIWADAPDRDDGFENVLLVAPVVHSDLTRKLGLLGFRGEPDAPIEQLAVPVSYDDDAAWDATVMSLGYIPYGATDA